MEQNLTKEFFDVVNVDIELNNLDLAFNNYKIINLTDIHIGQWLNPEYLEGVVEYVNTFKTRYDNIDRRLCFIYFRRL